MDLRITRALRRFPAVLQSSKSGLKGENHGIPAFLRLLSDDIPHTAGMHHQYIPKNLHLLP